MSGIPEPTMPLGRKSKRSKLSHESLVDLGDLRDPGPRRVRGKLSLTTFWAKIDGDQ